MKPLVERILVTLTFAMFLGQATGTWSFVGERACKEHCPTEQRGGACLPGCPDCACCGVGRVVAERPVVPRVVAPASEFVSSSTEDALASPDPEEIFHIPKPPLV
jgi:hypothetical protein